ncbi:MAG: hypothetical protein ACXV5F_08285 [Halobacteriota archaeon]
MTEGIMERSVLLGADELLLVHGADGVIGVAKSARTRQLFIETVDEELVMTVDTDDLFVASAFEDTPAMIKAIKCTLFLIRDVASPLIVLPSNHPASARLRVVASVGKRTAVHCDIQKGTHPEQDVLCGAPGLDGLEIIAADGRVVLRGAVSYILERIPFSFGIEG